MSVPVHLVAPGTERHGVTLLARQLAGALDAAVVTDPSTLGDGTRVHAHVSDRIFGRTPKEAAGVLVALGRRLRLTVTVHDVPQPTDGAAFERRRHCYSSVLEVSDDWAVCSHTERSTVQRHCAPDRPGIVVPLPVRPARPHRLRRVDGPVDPGAATVGVFGWIYPGKGHASAIEACALLGAEEARRPTVVALGAAAPGHDALVDELRRRAQDLGVRFTTTGWLDDAEVDDALAAVDIAYAAHANVSASGSLNAWLAVGRRPLVPAGAYTSEMAALRPGTLELYPAGADAAGVAARFSARLASPALGDLAEDAVVGPTTAEAAEAYRQWWDRCRQGEAGER